MNFVDNELTEEDKITATAKTPRQARRTEAQDRECRNSSSK